MELRQSALLLHPLLWQVAYYVDCSDFQKKTMKLKKKNLDKALRDYESSVK